MAGYISSQSFSGKGAIFYFNQTGASPPAFANSLGEIRSMKPAGAMMKSDDATNLQSQAEEFISTIRTSGTVDLTCNMLPTDPGYIAMEAIYYNQQPGRPIQGMIQFPLAPGQNTIGDQRWFLFFCEKFLPGNIEPSKLIQLEVSVKLTGDIVTVRGS
jgi:hypothetical protein